jgi:hypothetical protein
MVFDHLLPSVQPQSFLEWTHTSFEQSLAEFYTIPLEEHLQVALEILEVGKTDQSGSMMLKFGDSAGQGDIEVCLHALQTVTDSYSCVMGALLSWKTTLVFGNVWIMGCL